MEVDEPTKLRPMTLDFVRKELRKLGNPPEELVLYIWNLSNGKKEEANEYMKAIHLENQMRIEQLQQK